jgi:hypothetical protein
MSNQSFLLQFVPTLLLFPPFFFFLGRSYNLPNPFYSLCFYMYAYNYISGLDSSGDIVTDYGLDSPGIEFPWGRDFSHTS